MVNPNLSHVNRARRLSSKFPNFYETQSAKKNKLHAFLTPRKPLTTRLTKYEPRLFDKERVALTFNDVRSEDEDSDEKLGKEFSSLNLHLPGQLSVGLKLEMFEGNFTQAARLRFFDDSDLFVHYEGWGVEYDEWVPKSRAKLRESNSKYIRFGPNKSESDLDWDAIKSRAAQAQKEGHTGIVFDSTMLLHECTCDEPELWHPEQPERVVRLLTALDTEGLLDLCIKVKPRLVTEEELALAHHPSHIQTYGLGSATYPKVAPTLEVMACGGSGLACDTAYNTLYTPPAALMASGCVVELVKEVLTGNLRNGFAIVRPPGHHAEPNEALGFCYFNNVAIAAKVALRTYNIQRVLIVDWDIHHGNGTQSIFYDTNEVMYISVHRHDNGTFYPFSGKIEEHGVGVGEGFNVNIPFQNKNGMGDIDYLAAMHHVILPIARLYQPQLVLVSAGFDAAEGDAIGEYHVSKEGFSHMTHLLGTLAQEKLVLCLEGGYDVDALSSCAKACLRTLLDGRPTLLPTVSPIKGKRLSPSRQATRVFKKVLESQKKYMPDLATPDSFVLPTDEYITIAKGLIRKEGRLRPRRS